MLSLEQSTHNIIFSKGLFSIPVEAFRFNWDILYRIFESTFHKYEKFCPLLKTIQTAGGNPIIMPEDCIYPRAIGFGNAMMIPPQTVTVGSQSWSYNRQTRQLSVFTNTGSSAPFKVQYLSRHDRLEVQSEVQPFEVFDGEIEVEIQLDFVPDVSTLTISKGSSTLEISERGKHIWQFTGTLGTAELDLTSLILTITQSDTSAGLINIVYTGKYKAFDYITEDAEFFETWYAANILTSLGNIKAVVRMDAMPNTIDADQLNTHGKELLNLVQEFQKEKQFWWHGYIGARI